jgi:hypothetical protein
MSDAARFAFAPGLDVVVSGDRDAVRHFSAEYAGGGAPASGLPAALLVRYGVRGDGEPAITGGHKTVGWQVWVRLLDGHRIEADVVLSGRPRSFALSLTQGYVVEPLLSLASARRGQVLLPSAALPQDGGATILLGRSGAGKSTLMARALAAGRPVLADDQVLVAADGACRRFFRRARVYTDLPVVAPGAYAALGRGPRAALGARRIARTLSRGWVAPSLAVPLGAIGDPGPPGPLPLRRIVLLSRLDGLDAIAQAPATPAEVAEEALLVIDAQREKLAAAPALAGELAAARAAEDAALREAVADVVRERVQVPRAWDAPRAVAALAQRLGTE